MAINSDFRVVLVSTILRVHSIFLTLKNLFQLKALDFQWPKGLLRHKVLSLEMRKIPKLKEITHSKHKMCLLKILLSAVFQD